MKLRELAGVLTCTKILKLNFYDGNETGEPVEVKTGDSDADCVKLCETYGGYRVFLIHEVSMGRVRITLETLNYGKSKTPAAESAGESKK